MIPIVSIVGYSDSGKTTLVEKLIPEFKKRGYRVGTVKHSAHGAHFDTPGKDTWRHFAAGADAVVSASPEQIAVIRRPESLPGSSGDSSHARLISLAKYLEDVDIIIVEGYKQANVPKIEIFRAASGQVPVCGDDPALVAVVTDADQRFPVPVFGLEETSRLADFMEGRFLQAQGDVER